MTTDKPETLLIENCALCRVCGKGELSCSCDKPEPMSVDEAILLVLTGLGTERRQVAEVIRSLDERARMAERNFEQAAACHKEALCWYNEAKAEVAEQAKEIELLRLAGYRRFAAEDKALAEQGMSDYSSILASDHETCNPYSPCSTTCTGGKR